MFHHYGGIPLNGVEVLLLKSVACFGGSKDLVRQRNQAVRIRLRDAFVAGQRFVDSHHKLGKIVQPRE